ncbi:MAG: hypothetical protein WCD53_19910 [Microcoleus sp.]
MAINIPSKSEKHASELRDAVRLLAWDAYKLENSLKGNDAFNGYASFNDEWKDHEIQTMNLVQIEKFIKNLGYTTDELMKMRQETYERKALFKAKDKDNETSTDWTESNVKNFDVPY